MVLFMKGVCSSVMFVGSTSEEGTIWEIIWMLFKKGFLLYCDIWGKDCRGENYLEGHIRAVHEGMVPTVLFVLLFIYIIFVGIKHVGNNFSLKVIFMM